MPEEVKHLNIFLPILDNMDSQKRLHLEKTIKAFSYNFMGVTLPFILSLISIFILSKFESLWAFVDQGNFLLFAAGFYTSSLYVFGENQNSLREKKDKILLNLSLWLLIISSAIYAIIYGLTLTSNLHTELNTCFIRLMSFLLFVVSAYSAYRSIFIDLLKTYPEVDVEKESQKGVDDILNDL